MTKSRPVIDFGKEVYHIWITERPNQLAAALAYYGMFAFAPVIFIAVTVAGLFFDNPAVITQLFERLENALGPETAQSIQNSVESISQTTSEGTVLTTIISFIALFMAASGLFFQLQFALNTIWKVPLAEKGETSSYLKKRLFSFVMVIGVGLLLIIMTVASILFTWITSLLNLNVSGQIYYTLAGLGLALLSIALIYKVLPDVKISWRDVWIGAGVTTILVGIGGFLIGLYLKSSNVGSALEAAGSFAVILLGIYYVAQIFLFGAVFTRVYAHKFGSLRTLDGETE